MITLRRELLIIALLSLFYLVGIVGLSMDFSRDMFLSLTPLNLLLTLVLLTLGNKDYSKRYLIAFIAIYLTGFWVEVAGVHTEMLFGSYRYGAPLGLKFLEVPLIIGVNWFLVSFASMGIAATFTDRKWPRILLATVLTVGIDFLIEPVAVELGFWKWQNDIIPVQNYVMWFVTALFIQMILFSAEIRMRKWICISVYAVQVFFFALLNLSML